MREVCNKHGIELVLLATPTTPIERMSRIAKASQVGASTGREECIPPATSTDLPRHLPQGFIYLVSVTGVTGIKETMESRVEGLVATLHGVTDKPVGMT